MRIAMTAAMIAVGLTCAAGQASAADAALAQVSAIKGSVAVNQGGRIVPLTSATVLNAGDRLVSMEGGQARIKFADGCVVDVRSNAVATLGAKSPCAGAGLVKSSSPMQFDDPAWTAGLGILTVAALTWLVFEASDDGNSPLSP